MKKIKLKIASIFIGLLVAFILIEIGYRIKLRFFGEYEVFQKTQELVSYSDNEKLLVELIPNAQVTINDTQYEVNSLGYRDENWNLSDTTKIRIGLISDSVGFPFALP